MKIQVLGSGCPTCSKLFEMTKKAAKELNLEDQVEYLTGNEGITKIGKLGLMSSPVLTVDNKPVLVGFVNDIEKIKDLISGK